MDNLQISLFCVKVYMSIHISELKDKPDYVKAVWYEGQKLYHKNKRTSHEM